MLFQFLVDMACDLCEHDSYTHSPVQNTLDQVHNSLILQYSSMYLGHLITNPSYLGEISHGSPPSSIQNGSWFLILQYIIFHGSSHSSVQNTVEQIQNSPFLQYSTMFMDNLILVHETHNPSHTHGS